MRRLATALNARTRDAGLYVSPVLDIPVGQNFLQLNVARQVSGVDLPILGNNGIREGYQLGFDNEAIDLSGLDTEVARVGCFVSFDGGTTWRFNGGIGIEGGAHYNGMSGALMHPRYWTSIQQPENADRKVRLVMQSRARFSTEFSIDVESNPRAHVRRGPPHRSIAVEDSDSGSAASATTVATPSLTPAMSDRYVCAGGGHAHWKQSDTTTFTGCTYGATSMTQKFQDYSTYLDMCRAAGYELDNSGGDLNSDAAVTATVSATSDWLTIVALVMSGVDQTTPSDAAPTSSLAAGPVSTASVSITAGEAGDVRVAILATGINSNPTMTHSAGSGETRVVQANSGSGTQGSCVSIYTKSDDGTDAIDPSWDSGTDSYVLNGWNLNQAAAATANPKGAMGGLVLGGPMSGPFG